MRAVAQARSLCKSSNRPSASAFTVRTIRQCDANFFSSTPRSFDNGPLHDRYKALAGHNQDPIQLKALQSLERLRHDLDQQPPEVYTAPQTALTSWTPSWMSGNDSTSQTQQKQTQPIQGVYLHGGVGCGKTFLMNEVFDPPDNGWKDKQRQTTHFNKFMLRVHQLLHQLRQTDKKNHTDELLPRVVQSIVQNGRLLLFDEFQVTDVADALLLKELFTGLWQEQCVIVCTSNRPPDDLYLNGLQRQLFLPFIDLLKRHCQVVSMWESEMDYRLVMHQQGSGGDGAPPQTVYFAKETNKNARKAFDQLFYQIVGPDAALTPTTLTTQGRQVHIPQCNLSRGVCRFDFGDLCQKALGAADYLLIAQYFHTVFIENIPQLHLSQLNWVRRFITLIDTLYEGHIKVVCHAQTLPEDIFKEQSQDDEVFAFARTVSRLYEMSSETYLLKQQRKVVSSAESKASLLSTRKAVVNVVPA